MKINIRATKIDLTDAIRDFAQEKMDMLEKYLGDVKVINCDVEVGLVSNHHQKGDIYRAEVNLQVPGEILRVEKTEPDLYKSIDKVKDHLMRSIRRYKQKAFDKKRAGAADVPAEEFMEV